MSEFRGPGYLISVNERTRSEAAGIVSDEEDKEKSARELFEWVRDNYCWDMRSIESSEALLGRENSKAMSFSKSNLLISLLRSLDIPARIFLINCRMENKIKGGTESSIHGPVQIKVNGEWIVADPTYGPHTTDYHDKSEFGEETWEELQSSELKHDLDRSFVWGYNYILQYVHPDVRSIRKQLRSVQNI